MPGLSHFLSFQGTGGYCFIGCATCGEDLVGQLAVSFLIV